jgi:hypothetical protein
MMERRHRQGKLPGQDNEYRKRWIQNKRRLDPRFRKMESEKTRQWQLDHPVQAARSAYRFRCNKKKIPFELSDAQFERLLMEDCFYCGAKPNPINTIDRLDTQYGYIIGNVVTACLGCNRAKMDRSLLEFEEWLNNVASHYFNTEIHYGLGLPKV